MTTVAIVGGGFTGAAVAFHLAAAVSTDAVRIVIFEPRRRLGAGLAYDTEDPAHRINVPAAKMSLVPGDDEHFLRWLEAEGETADDPQACRPDGALFPRRAVFGRYVGAHVGALVKSGVVEHVREAIAVVERRTGAWLLTTASGARLQADILVNATTHPPPAPPAGLDGALAGHPRYVPDPNAPNALAAIRSDDRVLVVGTGLTGLDVVASLAETGHRGPVIAVSRRGLRSRGHAPFAADPFGDFTAEPARTARTLLRRVRAAVRAAGAAGLTWHAVFDALRSQGGAVWRALPIVERRRLVRHLRPYWDAHRFRVAPQVEAVVEAGRADGRVKILAARVVAVRRAGAEGPVEIDLRPRGSGTMLTRQVDAVVVATGPAHGTVLDGSPHLAALARAGLVSPDPIGLGIACDESGRALGADGRPQPTLFVAGPLARGTFGELMGLPQVADYAAFVARMIASLIEEAAESRSCGSAQSSLTGWRGARAVVEESL